MCKFTLFFFALLILTLNLNAAYYQALPMSISQPNGQVISCFASGDEFFNWLHDSNGYTIMQSPSDGYYYYATKINGTLVPSVYKVNSINPSQAGILPWLKLSNEAYQAKRQAFNNQASRGSKAPTTGTINNIAIYVRFSDQDEFSNNRTFFDAKFNDHTIGAISEYNYFQEVSYNTLNVSTTHYPVCEMTTNLSYQDPNPRNYYVPYNATSNPIGYQGNEYYTREAALLKHAVDFVSSQIPETLDIDADNNGKVDNVCFIIRGGNSGWADILWAHRYWLTTEYAYINNKRVYDYTLQPESQNDVNTLCHEMFHAMGSPDLYDYVNTDMHPCGSWDIMDSGYGHMGAYMKFRYGHWISEIPTITASGTYWLKPLSSPTHNVYRINSPSSTTDYFVVEYRKKQEGSFENNLPGSGLLIYRIDNQVSGQGNDNGPPYEVYIYRPGGTSTANGDAYSAVFNGDFNRSEFNGTSDPSCFLTNGNPGNIFIHNVSSAGDSISFVLNPEAGFLSGDVTTVPPIEDFSPISIIIGGQTVHPEPTGHFMLDMIYQGNYNLHASLEGYGSVLLPNVNVIPFQESVTGLISLQRLPIPQTLTREIVADSVYLRWAFNYDEAPGFDHFAIYISLNGTSFSGGRVSTARHFTMHLAANRNYWFYVKAVFTNGTSFASNTIIANTSVDNNDPIVSTITQPILAQNYPNPFNPETLIQFQFPVSATNPTLEIYNVRGELTRTYNCNNVHEIRWDGKNNLGNPAASGIYFYRLKSDNFSSSTRKMVLMK